MHETCVVPGKGETNVLRIWSSSLFDKTEFKLTVGLNKQLNKIKKDKKAQVIKQIER